MPHQKTAVQPGAPGVIDTQLTSAASDDPRELQQLSSLYRVLTQASTTSGESAVLRAFVEALTIWEDIESRAYRADVTGRFALAVALPGSDPTDAPASFARETLPPGNDVTRLSSVDRKLLGFQPSRDVLLARVGGRATSEYLIAATGVADARRMARFALYIHVVNQAMDGLAAIESARLTWALMQHLLVGTESPREAAEKAVSELSAIVEASVGLTLARSDGWELFTVGGRDSVVGAPAPAKGPTALTFRLDVPTEYTAILGARRPLERPFARRDEQLLTLAASSLSAWLIPVLRRLASEARLGDRRTAPRTFDQVIEQSHREAAARQEDVSVIVVFVGHAQPRPEVAQSWIHEIRGQLRPTDLAGRLTSGDLAVLLSQTGDEGAQAVARRLSTLMTAVGALRAVPAATIGVASHASGRPVTEPLWQRARAHLVGPPADSDSARHAR